MALESATYISDLVSTNPTSSDNLSQGDDHLRLLKSTIKATFPNVSGAVTPTHTELNFVDGVTSAIQPQLDVKAPLASPTFTGVAAVQAGTAALPSLVPTGDTNTGFWFPAADTIAASTGGSERMRIDASGNVGIGGTPSARLHVNSGAIDEVARFESTGQPFISLYDSGVRDFYIQDAASVVATVVEVNKPLAFHTNNTERMRIASTGDVLIGKTSAATAGAGIWAAGTGYMAITRAGTTSQSNVQFVNDNGVVGSIITNGSATSYSTSSDYRLKQNETPVLDPIGRFMQLKPISFEWKADGARVDGFLAHEVANVVPEAVVGTKDAVDANGNPIYQGIDQSKLVPLLTAALQEALTKIDALEARIEALEAA